MKKHIRKKFLNSSAALLLSALLALSGCASSNLPETTAAEISSAQAETENQAETATPMAPEENQIPAYEDDFYGAVNHELLNEWEIPADSVSVSWFQKLAEDNYEKLDQEIRRLSQEEALEPGGDGANISAMYLTGLDQDARNEGKYGRIAGAYLEQIDSAETAAELLDISLRFQRDYGIYSLLGFAYGVDGEDSSQYVLYMDGADTALEKEVWYSEDESNQKAVQEFQNFLVKLYELYGSGEEEAKAVMEQVTAMMKDLAGSALDTEELYDAAKVYNVYSAEDISEFFPGLVSLEQLSEIFGFEPGEKMIVQQVDLMKKLAGYLTDENLPLLKNYVKTCLYRDLGPYSDMETFKLWQDYMAAVNGTEKKDLEREVSEQVQDLLGFQCGRIFCETYFSEKAKKEVEAMVEQVIQVYDSRISELDWMTETTKSEARKKLSALTSRVGYPDKWPQDLYELTLKRPEDGGLFLDNCLAVSQASQNYSFQIKDEPVDHELWSMVPQEVNAYYDASSNSITLLAGILQEPIYTFGAAPEENLGRIGMVIGHEITHAFDTSGSQYDENGNLRDWWTEEDKEKFSQLAEKTIQYYNSMEIDGKPIDGTLTLTENIADLGAVSCVTEIAEKNGYDLKKVYTAYAGLWVRKDREDYLVYQLSTDVHSPGKIRTNAVLSAMDAFYELFDVEEGDGMYQKPEDRPKIW